MMGPLSFVGRVLFFRYDGLLSVESQINSSSLTFCFHTVRKNSIRLTENVADR